MEKNKLYAKITNALNMTIEKDVFKSNLYSVNIFIIDKNRKNKTLKPIYDAAI